MISTLGVPIFITQMSRDMYIYVSIFIFHTCNVKDGQSSDCIRLFTNGSRVTRRKTVHSRFVQKD